MILSGEQTGGWPNWRCVWLEKPDVNSAKKCPETRPASGNSQVTTSTTYDSRNRPITQTDGEGTISTTTYDTLSRITSSSTLLTVNFPLITSFTYDLAGNLLTTKAADNVITSTRTYDALDRLKTDKDGANRTITYNYDALGRMTSYTDAKGATFAFAFDKLGRKTSRTEPDATSQSYTYDPAGRPVTRTKADGRVITNHYAIAARDFLTKMSFSNGEPDHTFTYDKLGRLLTAANQHAAFTRTYDAAGRNLSETQAISGLAGSYPFTYTYDVDGLPTAMTRPDGSVVAYDFDARAWLKTVSADGPPPLAAYAYNGRGQVTATTIEAGVFTRTQTYDAAGRLTAVNNGTLDTTAYTLSADGRRTAATKNGQAETYGYDNARQVTSAAYGGTSTTQSWQYDLAGNRQTATTNSLTETYNANSVNQYTAWSGGFQPPTYDPNGNQTNSGNGLAMTWDINDRLVAASNATSGNTATYGYDALGRRVRSTSTISNQQSTIFYLLDGWNVNLEHNGTAYTARHTWGLDLSGSMQGAGGVGGLLMTEDLTQGANAVANYPAYDGNGNITALISISGTVTATYRYDAYGNLLASSGPAAATNKYRFSTKPIDEVTGLYYYGYRYYDPATGRWPSRDPIEENGGLNLYGFVGNDGVNQWDTLGLTGPHQPRSSCSSYDKVRPMKNGADKEGRSERDAGHYKAVNGCDIIPDFSFGLASFTDACHKHDVCYQTCGMSKKGCDANMFVDMMAACDDISVVLYPLKVACRAHALAIHEALASGIGSTYEESQDYHCEWDCCEE